MIILPNLKTALAWLAVCRPIQQNKIVVSSFYGRGYSDNPKAIVDALLRRERPLDIVWLCADEDARSSLPEGVRACAYDSPQKIRELCTAKVWIDNSRKGARWKRKKQIYLQTWHGFALKRIEKDVTDKLPPAYEAYAKRDSLQTDLIVSGSSHMTRIYRESFWYDGEIGEFGSPRNDILFQEREPLRQKICDAFGISEKTGLVLYAPTFRADGSLSAYCLDYEAACRACEERFGGQFVMLVRLHPHAMALAKQLRFDGVRSFDASSYPDMMELLSAADVLITDYSSCMFDFALTGRPCFQFAVDIAAYKNDRNFYFPIDDTPFGLAVDNRELYKEIIGFDERAYARRLREFNGRYGMKEDGRASDRCADWILTHMEGQQTT